ncbi:MAG: hypothetical protein ACRCSG_02465 [Cellulosilyticaceae bacterium]
MSKRYFRYAQNNTNPITDDINAILYVLDYHFFTNHSLFPDSKYYCQKFFNHTPEKERAINFAKNSILNILDPRQLLDFDTLHDRFKYGGLFCSSTKLVRYSVSNCLRSLDNVETMLSFVYEHPEESNEYFDTIIKILDHIRKELLLDIRGRNSTERTFLTFD